jgi:hypothetical protein
MYVHLEKISHELGDIPQVHFENISKEFGMKIRISTWKKYTDPNSESRAENRQRKY